MPDEIVGCSEMSGQGSVGNMEKMNSGAPYPLEEVKEVLELTPQWKGRKIMEFETTRGTSSKRTKKLESLAFFTPGNLGKNLMGEVDEVEEKRMISEY